MTNPVPPTKPQSLPPAPKPDPATLLAQQVSALTKIEEHLKSIRSQLNFFTIVIVLGVVLAGCSVLASFLNTP